MNHYSWKDRIRKKHQDEAEASLARLRAAKAKLPATSPAAYHTDLADLEAKCQARVSKVLETKYAYKAKFNAALAEEFARQSEAKVTKAIHLYGQKAS